jgi:small-conductance mechanosensitive channel/CRP-like cAMP-binding protein
MNIEAATNSMYVLFERFFQPGQAEVIIGGIALWLLLRRLLPTGSQYVLKQTITFFTLCLFGEFGAALMNVFGWSMAATGLYEVTLLGVGVALIRFVGLLLFRVLMPALKADTPRILEDITVIVGYCVWLMVRLRFAGLELSQLVATSTVITAIIAFAMQDTLGNILGGLAIHLDHSVEIGDWVVADGVSGRVVDIRWRYTKIATRNGEKVVMPNSQLMKNKFSVVGVYSEDNMSWRRWIGFNVGFDHPPAKVIDVIEHAITEAEIADVARNPAPSCVVMEFGPGYSHYALRYWLTNPAFDDPTDSVVRLHLVNALARAGIAMAIPVEERHIVKENESHDKVIAEQELLRRQEALGHVVLFQSLTREEKRNLAAYLTHTPFASGDIITRQGAVADWLYIMVSGEAEVWLEQRGDRRLLSTLPAGSVFGEMGLMTGEPRRATVIAKTDVDCYRLGKQGLEALMHSRPSIAEEISHVLAARNVELEQLRHSFDSAAPIKQAEHRESLLGRIKDFFKLTG